MKYLVSYAWKRPQTLNWDFAHSIEKTPTALLERCQNYPEYFIIVNTIEVSDEWAEKWNGNMKGM